MTANPNISFLYMYRDASNYKQHGEVILPNETQLTVEEVDQQIRSLLSDGLFFIARQVQIEERFFAVVNEDDHPWHEFVSVEATAHPTLDPVPESKRDITQFLKELAQAQHSGWNDTQIREDINQQIEKEKQVLKRWLDSIPENGEASSYGVSKPVSDVKLQYGDEHENPV